MKYVVSSAEEAEMTALFLTAKEMVPLRQTLTEMGWKQPPSPIQSDNYTELGMTNCTLIPRNQSIGTCALTGYNTGKRNTNFDYIGTRFQIIMVTTAQSTTQTFTMKPKGPWVLRGVYFTLIFFVCSVEPFCLELHIVPARVC